jgi:pyruvate kinase
MNLLWGVHPVRCAKAHTAEQMVDMAEQLLEEGGYVRPQDILGIVAGTRTKTGSTNFLRLHVLGDRLTAPIVKNQSKSQPKKAAAKSKTKKR